MTGHIAALIERWRLQLAFLRDAAGPAAETVGLGVTAEQLAKAADRLEKQLQELEAARDADCAELRKRMRPEFGLEWGAFHDAIVKLGGKP